MATYTIDSVDIEIDKIVPRVTITFDDGHRLEIVQPVKLPQTAEDVLKAIDYRHGLEVAKYNAAPLLTTVKAELEAKCVGKASDTLDRK